MLSPLARFIINPFGALFRIAFKVIIILVVVIAIVFSVFDKAQIESFIKETTFNFFEKKFDEVRERQQKDEKVL